MPERYVSLCLQVGEHFEDFVDAYIGPAALREEIVAGEPREPAALRDDALVLLEELPAADLEPDRVRWLRGQLEAVECVTARLAGEEIVWSDEVERCFGIRPRHVDEDVFRASHRNLDDALPGNGDLSARYNAWRDSTNVPGEVLPRAIELLASDLRRRARDVVALPRDETVEWATVTDVTWQAFNWYRGDLHSLVQVNVDLPVTVFDLADLVAHEAYPGHHTERACKEEILYRGGARAETSVMVLLAPEAVVAEGIATNALDVAVGEEGIGAVLDVVAGLGLGADPATAAVVLAEEERLFAAATNAARMLHEDGLSTSDAESYLREWALQSPERAAKTVSFLLDPGTRAYPTAYTDGRRVCREFMDREPGGFRRLLTEQLTVSSLLDAGT